MIHQFDVLAGQNGAGLSRCVRARIVMMIRHNDSISLVRFSNCCEDFRQTNCDAPLRIDRPTMLKWKSRHMTSFAKETGHHLLQSASSTNNFRWIWPVFEDPHGGLWFCFGLLRIDPWFVTCDDLIKVFWSTALVNFQYAGGRMSRMPLSNGMSHDLHFQFTHAINVFWHNGCYCRTFTELVFERATATIEFIAPVFHSEWCFMAK